MISIVHRCRSGESGVNDSGEEESLMDGVEIGRVNEDGGGDVGEE